MFERVWRKGTFLYCWWECKLVQPLWRTVWRFFKKLKIELLYFAIPLLGVYPEKNCKSKRYMHVYVHSSAVHNSRDMETTQMPTDRWWTKMWHMYGGTLLSHEKECNNAICCMDGPRDRRTEWSTSERERQMAYAIAYVWNLKTGYKWTSLHNRNRATDTENKVVVSGG